jgi:hypothetical protein
LSRKEIAMQFLTKSMLIVAGIIHLLPLPGLLGGAHLERLYGIPFSEPNLVILMRHRAVLFGLLGGFIVYAAMRTDLVWIAILGGLVSAGAFVWLAWSVGVNNSAVSRIVVADVIAIICLIIAAASHARSG